MMPPEFPSIREVLTPIIVLFVGFLLILIFDPEFINKFNIR